MFVQDRNRTASSKKAQPNEIARYRGLAMVLATLAAGMSFAAPMAHNSALATPLACPVPDGTIVSGNNSLEVGATVCVIGSTTIQAGGQLDNNNFGPSVTQDDTVLINDGVLNHNSISSAASFNVRGTVENGETGTVNINNGPQPIIGGNFIIRGDSAEGPNFSNAGVLNNRAITVNRGGSSTGRVSTLDNTGSINNFTGATFINHSTLINQASGLITNDGTFNTSVGLAEGQTIASSFTNFGTFDNNNIWNNGDGSVVTGEFNNHGVINNIGTLNTNRVLRNLSEGIINNTGTIKSDELRGGELQNLGTLINRNGGVLDLVQGLQVGGTQPGEATGIVTNEAGGEVRFTRLINRASVVNEAGGTFGVRAEGGLLSNTATGTIDNAGLFDLSPGGAAFVAFNFGEIINRSGGTVVMHAGALVTATESSITNEAGGVLELTDPGARILTSVDSDISNAGTIRIAAQTTIARNQVGGDFTQTGGSTIVDGTLSQRTIDIRGGSLSGSGTVEALGGPVTVRAGASINPGNSPGTMVINSDFLCDACLIEIEIGGRNDGQFDFLDIAGDATFLAGSQILFSFIDGFAPLEIDLFEFLEADGSIFGLNEIEFLTAGLADGFVFDVGGILGKTGGSALALDAGNNSEPAPTAVPEPAAAGLFGFGLLGLGWLRRRRNKFDALKIQD